MNAPYDLEAGRTNNQRLERVFLEHTYRWLKPGGVLIFVIPQSQLNQCARLLAEHFRGLRVYRLTDHSQFPAFSSKRSTTAFRVCSGGTAD